MVQKILPYKREVVVITEEECRAIDLWLSDMEIDIETFKAVFEQWD